MKIYLSDAPAWAQEIIKKQVGRVKYIDLEYVEIVRLGPVMYEWGKRYLFARRPQDGQVKRVDSCYYDGILNASREEKMTYFGGEINLPPGGELLEIETTGRGQFITLYRHPSLGGNGLPLENGDDLTEKEKIVLYIHSAYIASVRQEYYRQAGLKKQEVENIIRSLQEKGYMYKNKALTLKGKNVAQNLNGREIERQFGYWR